MPNELWIKIDINMHNDELQEVSVSSLEREGYTRYIAGDVLENTVNALTRLVGRLNLALNDFGLMVEVKPLVSK